MNNDSKQTSWEDITCLIVDDDKFSRTFIKTALSQIGIKHTFEAATSTEAAEILSTESIDLILLDQQMPKKSGLEFAKELKSGSLGDTQNIPIIMVTVDTKEKTVVDAKELGIYEYLVKPVSPLALKKRIQCAFEITMEKE
ncbi:MAG: response regulator [Lactobacillus sp.]|jgi:DNA-binding response OmpR family regulator|nr:response regulator [Lactobacillus sp.]